MPYSLKGGKEQTAEWFLDNQDKISRVLDIGVGSGTYARLIKDQYGICKNADWVGIEAWTPYIEKFNLNSLYNTIINEDARKINWDTLGSFSTTIAGDVLEHMSKKDAMELVDKILNYSNVLIISIPIIHMPQSEGVYNNPFEVHVKDDWTHDEVLSTWGNYIFKFYRKSVKSKIAVYWLRKHD